MSYTRRQRLTRLQTTTETLEELEPMARRDRDDGRPELLEAMRLVSLWMRARYAALASELEDDDEQQ